jgi:hypothetical protein
MTENLIIDGQLAVPDHKPGIYGATFAQYARLCPRKALFYAYDCQNTPSINQREASGPGGTKGNVYFDRGVVLHLMAAQHYARLAAPYYQRDQWMHPVERAAHAIRTGVAGRAWRWHHPHESVEAAVERLHEVYTFFERVAYEVGEGQRYTILGVEQQLPALHGFAPTADLLLFDEEQGQTVIVDLKVMTYLERGAALDAYVGDLQMVGYSACAENVGISHRVEVHGLQVRSAIKGNRSIGPGTFGADAAALESYRKALDIPLGLRRNFAASIQESRSRLENVVSVAGCSLDSITADAILTAPALMSKHICASESGQCPYLAACWR